MRWSDGLALFFVGVAVGAILHNMLTKIFEGLAS
jgi:hypothetical protein